MDLIKFILAWEQRLFGDEFEEHTAETPNVHLLIIIAVSHEALGSTIPPGGDVVSIGRGRVFALAGAKVSQLDEVSLHKNVLRFDIAVEDALAVHELDGPEDLEHVEFDFLEGEWIFFIFEGFVEVHVHEFEDER
jgi:hypothetical protein